MYWKIIGRRIAFAFLLFASVSCSNGSKENEKVNYNDLLSKREIIYIDEITNPTYDAMMKLDDIFVLQKTNGRQEIKLVIMEAEERGFYMYMLEDMRVIAIPIDGGSSIGIITRESEFERLEINVEKTLKNLESKIE